MAWFYEQLTEPYFNWGLIIYTGNISFSLEWLHAGEWLSLLLDKKRNIFELLGTIEIFYKLHLQSYLLFTYFLTVKTFLLTKISYHKKREKERKKTIMWDFLLIKVQYFYHISSVLHLTYFKTTCPGFAITASSPIWQAQLGGLGLGHLTDLFALWFPHNCSH